MKPALFYYKKSYLQRSLFISAALLALAIYFVMTTPSSSDFITILFVVVIALYGFKSGKFALEFGVWRPVIEIGEEGVYDRNGIGKLPLAWSSIESFVVIKRPQSIAIITNDTGRRISAETLASRVSNFLRKLMGRPGSVFMLTPPSALDGEMEHLLAALKSHNTNESISFGG